MTNTLKSPPDDPWNTLQSDQPEGGVSPLEPPAQSSRNRSYESIQQKINLLKEKRAGLVKALGFSLIATAVISLGLLLCSV